MVSSKIGDLLTAFSPALDYFAISSGDGRIKIWDTVKGQLQTEFADITSSEGSFFNKTARGHLSIDYTCMKWLSLDRKKKRKLGSSLLVLGTGSGDVLAVDVSAGQLKWSVSDCHPGGVSAVSFSKHDSCIYSGGADGMICKIDPQTGNTVEKFKASNKAVSCMSVSPDAKILATASGQLKVLSCSGYKKIQKYSGHPGAVRSMIFTEDGKYILSSAVGERYIAIWRIGGGKKQSASCVLAMEHPAVFIDSVSFQNEGGDDAGLHILAISETGFCYTWFAKNIDELRGAKPTRVSPSAGEPVSRSHQGALHTILAAKLQGTAKDNSVDVFIAHGLLVKPSFQKITVHSGVDIQLNSSQDGVLLPMQRTAIKSKKARDLGSGVTALDRANVEDALLPIPKIIDFHVKKSNKDVLDSDVVMADLSGSRSQDDVKDDDVAEDDTVAISIEKKLRQCKILSSKVESLGSTAIMGIDIEDDIPQRKMRAIVSSMEPSNAYKLLEKLVEMWQSRFGSGKHVLPWISCILINHGRYIMDHESSENQLLGSLMKATKSRGVAVQPLLQLSGRLQLITAQIDKATFNKLNISSHNDQTYDDEEEEDDDDVEEHVFGEDNEDDDESQLSSDDDS